nr:substrate-binding domain-containing protein [uncultured Carboxylicivirga sp.]
MAKYIIWILLFSGVLVTFSGCKQKKKDTAFNEKSQKEILVYCENSMLDIVLNLKEQFEEEYNCKIRIQNDCAQNLMDVISYTGKGDIYIPSSTATFEKFYSQTGQALMDSVLVGYNSLTFMVKKGNPTKFDGKFSSLLHNKYSLIIADPETSSVGLETQKLLKRHNIYNEILPQVVSLTTDSRGLIKSLKNNQADVVIDWKSNQYVSPNREYIEIIQPKTENNHLIPTYAATLSCSSQPTLSNAFLNFTNTHLNESQLSKYGFTRRETIIF